MGGKIAWGAGCREGLGARLRRESSFDWRAWPLAASSYPLPQTACIRGSSFSKPKRFVPTLETKPNLNITTALGPRLARKVVALCAVNAAAVNAAAGAAESTSASYAP
jgi:hypothetical protein